MPNPSKKNNEDSVLIWPWEIVKENGVDELNGHNLFGTE